MKTAAIYCRVSTEDQGRDGTSLKTQLDACRSHCKDNGYVVSHRSTETCSGLTLDRPQLIELRNLVRANSIDVVVVYSLDRLSRDPVQGLILLEELERYNATLEAVAESVDHSEIGKLIYHIKGYAAKLDAERRKDATMRGKKFYLDKGQLPQGTGIGIYGYNWDKKAKRRIINSNEAAVVRRIFDLLCQGQSLYAVAKELNARGIPTKGGVSWHPLTLRRMIKNPAYYGMTYFKTTKRLTKGKVEVRPKEDWIKLPDVTPPIIDFETYEKAQKMLKLPRFAPGKAMVDYLLRGHAYCAECKGRLTGTMLNRRFRYYRCSHTKPTSTRPATCRQSYINASKLEQIVWESVREVLAKPEHIKSQVKQIVEGESGSSQSESQFEKEIAKLRKRIKSYDVQHKRLLRHVQHDTFSKDNVLDAINQLKTEKAEAEGQITELTEAKKRLQQLREAEIKLDDWCAMAQQNIEDADNETKRLAFTMLDLKVYATRDKVDIKGIIPVDLVTIAQTSA